MIDIMDFTLGFLLATTIFLFLNRYYHNRLMDKLNHLSDTLKEARTK